jgi:thioester reductase-like protein
VHEGAHGESMGSWADGDILLTGATGLVGGELLPRLLRAAPAAEVVCLVRARDDAALALRREALLVHARVPAADATRVRVARGDACEPDLGLGSAREALAKRVRSVVHAAASTRFDLELEAARRTNVAGSRHLLEFARASGARLHHVSTAYVAGARSGVLRVRDADGTAGFHNTYETSKWEAEAALRLDVDVRTTVYRPSIIVGDSKSGRTPHFRVLYEPFKWVIYGKTSVLPCRPDVRLDVVPVDYVADAIVALGAQASSVGQTYHLSAGPERSSAIAELVALSEPIVNGWLDARAEPRVLVPRIVSPEDATPDQAQLFALGAEVMRTHVPYMLAEQVFDDAETRAALAGSSLACPALRGYLARLLTYALERRFGAD